MEGVRRSEESPAEKSPGLNGYMTLEAAMVFPAVFVLVIMILYVTFFLYDKCRMTQELYAAAYRRSIERGKDSREIKVDTSAFLLLNGCSAEVGGGGEIRATAAGNMVPAMTAGAEGEGGSWGLTVTMSARKTDPPYAFRRYRRVTAIAEQVLSQGE